MFKTNMLLYQPKAKLDVKRLFGKIAHLQDPTISKIPVRSLYRNRENPRSILVHDLCGIEVYIASLRNSIRIAMRIAIECKSWTRMEC